MKVFSAPTGQAVHTMLHTSSGRCTHLTPAARMPATVASMFKLGAPSHLNRPTAGSALFTYAAWHTKAMPTALAAAGVMAALAHATAAAASALALVAYMRAVPHPRRKRPARRGVRHHAHPGHRVAVHACSWVWHLYNIEIQVRTIARQYIHRLCCHPLTNECSRS